MHNKHAEEVVEVKIVPENEHNDTRVEIVRDGRHDVTLYGCEARAVIVALHSAVQKEREEFAEAVKRRMFQPEYRSTPTGEAIVNAFCAFIDRIKSDKSKL